MPPHTKLPTPVGHIQVHYDPMSPPNWGIVPFAIDVFVYQNVRVALQALLRAATTIHAQRLEEGTAELLTNNLLFRGQSEVTQRILPTRLRGPRRSPDVRKRFNVAAPPSVKFNGVEFPSNAFETDGDDPRNHWGDWFERVRVPSIDDCLAELPNEELRSRDALEVAAIDRACSVSEVAGLDPFRRRAAVRHYSGALSPLLDLSTDPEVAAFFATGGASRQPAPGTIGALWAIDVNFLADLFSIKTTSIPGGEKMTLTERRDEWGDNKAMFEKFGALPTRLEFDSVQLPFQRPQAQHARFVSLAGEDGGPLPPKTELTWWSIIERRGYPCAFIQDGCTYENPDHNVTGAALWPENEPLANALAGRT
jgi:hypothetical protein